MVTNTFGQLKKMCVCLIFAIIYCVGGWWCAFVVLLYETGEYTFNVYHLCVCVLVFCKFTLIYLVYNFQRLDISCIVTVSCGYIWLCSILYIYIYICVYLCFCVWVCVHVNICLWMAMVCVNIPMYICILFRWDICWFFCE